MPLLDHFHPPLHGPRHWEGFLHGWASFIACELNQGPLPPKYFAEPEISLGPRLETCEIRVYQDLDGAELRGVVELIGPANKDRAGSRRTFAAKCVGYLMHGIGVVIVDIVTSRSANLHEDVLAELDETSHGVGWSSSTGLYAIAYRAVTATKVPRLELWPEALALGLPLPALLLWLQDNLCVPLRLEESYLTTCRSLRIPA